MPKLYHNGQLEGWQVPGQQDKKATRVDIPSAPAELATWLNHRRVGPTGLAAELERTEGMLPETGELEPEIHHKPQGPKVYGHCDACGRSATGALRLARGNELDSIAEWLEGLQLTDLWVMQRLGDLIGERARALGAEYTERSIN